MSLDTLPAADYVLYADTKKSVSGLNKRMLFIMLPLVLLSFLFFGVDGPRLHGASGTGRIWANADSPTPLRARLQHVRFHFLGPLGPAGRVRAAVRHHGARPQEADEADRRPQR